MVTMSNLSLSNREDLGIDMYEVYQSSCFSPYFLPSFTDLYANYQIEVLKKETDLSAEQIKSQMELVEKGYYQMEELLNLSTERIDKKPEAFIFNYLIEEKYSFEHKKSAFNAPSEEVW